LLAQEKQLHGLKSAALEFVTRRDSGLSSEEFAAWRAAIRRDKIPEQKIPPPLQEYARVATAAGQARSQLECQLEEELSRARRAVFLERWTAHALAAAINSDPQTFLEHRPRLNPNGLLIDNRFVFVDSGIAIEISLQELPILARCNGATPMHTFVAAGGASS